MKIDWKRKLTSRKFWSAIVGFITPLLIAFNVSSDTATQVTSIIMSGGALIAYIIGEGLADSSAITLVDSTENIDNEDEMMEYSEIDYGDEDIDTMTDEEVKG